MKCSVKIILIGALFLHAGMMYSTDPQKIKRGRVTTYTQTDSNGEPWTVFQRIDYQPATAHHFKTVSTNAQMHPTAYRGYICEYNDKEWAFRGMNRILNTTINDTPQLFNALKSEYEKQSPEFDVVSLLAASINACVQKLKKYIS